MSVTAARGFRATNVRVNPKTPGKSDLALVVNDGLLDAVTGVFTANRVAAAPVVWSHRLLADQEDRQADYARTVVLNPGNTNIYTRVQGMYGTGTTASHTTGPLGAKSDQVLVCSMGVIGECINMPILLGSIDIVALILADTPQVGTDVATTVMTTDTVSKEDALTVGAGEQSWTIGDMIRGMGILAPGLTAMFAIITADTVLTPQQARDALASATMRAASRINSDGCTFTDDTVVLLASGVPGITPPQDELDETLAGMMSRLSRRLVTDAEGTAHGIVITVSGVVSEETAKTTAHTVSSSSLLKYAVAEADPDWGYILSQLGTIPEDVCPFNPGEVNVAINSITIFSHGASRPNRNAAGISLHETYINIELSADPAQTTVWTNDLTRGYVTISANYTT